MDRVGSGAEGERAPESVRDDHRRLRIVVADAMVDRPYLNSNFAVGLGLGWLGIFHPLFHSFHGVKKTRAKLGFKLVHKGCTRALQAHKANILLRY